MWRLYLNQEGTASAQPASAAAPAVTASAASAPTAATASATGQTAGNELVVKVRYYRSVLVIKDKNGTDVINRVVPAGSEHTVSKAVRLIMCRLAML